MCAPMLLAAGAAGAQSAVSFAASQQDYNNQVAAWQENYVSSLKAGEDEQKRLQLRMSQEGEAISQKRHLANIEKAQATSAVRNSAGAAGVSGVSVSNIITGVSQKVSAKRQADEINFDNTIEQLSAELLNTNTKTQNRINSVQQPTPPNPLGFVLQAAGGIASAAGG